MKPGEGKPPRFMEPEEGRDQMADEEYERRRNELHDRYVNTDMGAPEFAALSKELKIERGAVVYITINEDGDCEVGTTSDEALERLKDNCGGYLARVVRLTAKIAPPVAEEGPSIDIPDEAGTTQQIEVEAAQ